VLALWILERTKSPVKTDALTGFSKFEHVDPHAHIIVTPSRLAILQALLQAWLEGIFVVCVQLGMLNIRLDLTVQMYWERVFLFNLTVLAALKYIYKDISPPASRIDGRGYTLWGLASTKIYNKTSCQWDFSCSTHGPVVKKKTVQLLLRQLRPVLGNVGNKYISRYPL